MDTTAVTKNNPCSQPCLAARRMILTSIALVFLSCVGCSPSQQTTHTPPGQKTSGQVSHTGRMRGADLPPDTQISATRKPEIHEQSNNCPYLDNNFLQNTTGQKITSISLDQRFDPPACIFWSYEQQPQATIIIRHMHTDNDAMRVLDWYAPKNSSLPAHKPSGWHGRRRGGSHHTNAVYAVRKQSTTICVILEQKQSIKAQTIAEKTINTLSL